MVVEDRVQPFNFFRTKLLRLTNAEQLRAFLSSFEKDKKRLSREIVEIMWYMRGSLSREEAWTLSSAEREDYMEYIAERMKVVEKTRLPLI